MCCDVEFGASRFLVSCVATDRRSPRRRSTFLLPSSCGYLVAIAVGDAFTYYRGRTHARPRRRRPGCLLRVSRSDLSEDIPLQPENCRGRTDSRGLVPLRINPCKEYGRTTPTNPDDAIGAGVTRVGVEPRAASGPLPFGPLCDLVRKTAELRAAQPEWLYEERAPTSAPFAPLGRGRERPEGARRVVSRLREPAGDSGGRPI